MKCTYGWTKQYLTKDGKPWLPVMGEFHFSRYPHCYWREELEKMKRLAGYKYSDDNKKVDTGKMETMSESISNFREKLNN